MNSEEGKSLEHNINDSQIKEIFTDIFAFFGALSANGFILSLSGKLFEQTDINPDVIIGQKFIDLVFWQSSEYTSENLKKIIEEAAKGNPSRLIVEFRVDVDERKFLELNFHPVLKEGEDVEQIVISAYDITTSEKEVRYFKEKSDSLLFAAENADVGLWDWDLSENVINSTPKCKELFEIPANDELTFEKFRKILHPEDRQKVEEALEESQKTGKDYNEEYRVKYSQGNIIWISARGKTFIDKEGKPIKMMGVVQNITDRKIAGEELSKVFDREKKARDEAEEANSAKDFFLAVVSHELRSPLNAILGWSKILLGKELDEDTQRKALETIEKSARSQAKLLDDLIDSSRITSGKLRLEYHETNLYDIVMTVFNLQKPTAEEKNISFELTSDSEDITVYGDKSRLQQVVSNLLSNALKFTPEGGKIQLILHTSDGFVSTKIKDNGQGIEPEYLPNIFRQFQQGNDNISDNKGGLGLGLSISKILIEKHKGTISAESEGIGTGATFNFTLPLIDSTASTVKDIRASKPKEGKILNGINILIIEDDADSREVLQLFLEQSGARVESCENAQEGFSFLVEEGNLLPDIIVSDLAMPNEDGYSLINRIRSLSKEMGGEIPALALSAFASNENKQKAYDAGFQHYHTKPFEPDVLIEDILKLAKIAQY